MIGLIAYVGVKRYLVVALFLSVPFVVGIDDVDVIWTSSLSGRRKFEKGVRKLERIQEIIKNLNNNNTYYY